MSRIRCSRCSQTDTSPRNFILKCSVCSTPWHHRCHQPVVDDAALIALIRADTASDYSNGLASWKCSACLRRPPSENPLQPTQKLSTVPGARAPVNHVIDLTFSSDGEEEIKPERVRTPVPPPPRHNYAPTWIHNRHSTLQAPDLWDRLAKKRLSQTPRRTDKAAAKKSMGGQDTFVLDSAIWLRAHPTPNKESTTLDS